LDAARDRSQPNGNGRGTDIAGFLLFGARRALAAHARRRSRVARWRAWQGARLSGRSVAIRHPHHRVSDVVGFALGGMVDRTNAQFGLDLRRHAQHGRIAGLDHPHGGARVPAARTRAAAGARSAATERRGGRESRRTPRGRSRRNGAARSAGRLCGLHHSHGSSLTLRRARRLLQ
jgi:hypothetical protein